MINVLIAMMFFGVGYGPPTEYDVLTVLQKRFYAGSDVFVDSYLISENYNLKFNNFPVTVSVQHCDPFETEGRKYGFRSQGYDRGYRCLVEVVPHAVPPFYVSGNFTFDGLDWRYFGEDVRRQIRPQEIINRKNVQNGRTVLKPGALPYDGFPTDPFNDKPSPYADILGLGADSPF